MSGTVVTNWFGDLVSHPRVIVEASSASDIIRILKNPDQYPSPVRAVGSNHSTAPCGVADGGTLVKIKMNRILGFTADTVAVEAGALYIDIAKELEKRTLQFYVNTEIGSLSAGSAACAGTKDASMPGEFGQVGSYVVGVKMVLPSGELLEVKEGQQDLMIDTLPELKALNYSMMFYIFPFEDLITVEFRRYNPTATGKPNRHAWELRNYLWSKAGPRFAQDIENSISDPKVRYAVIDGFCAMWRFKLENLVVSENTVPTDQIIRYPTVSDDSRYTFSLFAFAEERYPQALTDFFQFCRDYYHHNGYRSNLLNVGYRIAKDQQSLLSYSYEGPVMTVDPVSTGNPGWKTFLEAYNEFCAARGGVPLLNQTYGVGAAQADKAFGDRLKVFEETRKAFDPTDRLLNEYFKGLLSAA